MLVLVKLTQKSVKATRDTVGRSFVRLVGRSVVSLFVGRSFGRSVGLGRSVGHFTVMHDDPHPTPRPDLVSLSLIQFLIVRSND